MSSSIFATKRIKTSLDLIRKVVTFSNKKQIKSYPLEETYKNYQKGIPASRAISFFEQMAKIESCSLCQNIDKKFNMKKLEKSHEYVHQKCLIDLQKNDLSNN